MSQEKNLHPITRKEKILDGQDLAPMTRLEYFIKKAATKGEGGGGGGTEALLVANLAHIEGESGEEILRLDKTWRECRDADAIIIRDSWIEPIDRLNFSYVATVTKWRSLSDPTQTDYRIIYVIPDTSGADGVSWQRVTLSTNAESGYPEVTL